MPKLKKEYSEQLVVRLTPRQRQFVEDIAELHGLRPSEFIRGLINNAGEADRAIYREMNTAMDVIDKFYEEVINAKR